MKFYMTQANMHRGKPPNNTLHLQTTAVIILAKARMPPYASFKLAYTLDAFLAHTGSFVVAARIR